MAPVINTTTSDPKSSEISPEDLATLDPTQIPRHIAIIQDGSRRWAQQNELPLEQGHREGVQATVRTVRAASAIGVKTLTLYTFSTENWSRPQQEVSFLMALLEMGLIDLQEEMKAQNVRLHAIGDLAGLPDHVRTQLEKTIAYTSDGQGIEVILAINYGSRDEMRRAIVTMLQDQRKGRLNEQDLDENKIATYLDTAKWGDPELFIRTSGECRLSNFLLWQLSYGELYFTDTLWPDFGADPLLKAIRDYQKRSKRLGS